MMVPKTAWGRVLPLTGHAGLVGQNESKSLAVLDWTEGFIVERGLPSACPKDSSQLVREGFWRCGVALEQSICTGDL